MDFLPHVNPCALSTLQSTSEGQVWIFTTEAYTDNGVMGNYNLQGFAEALTCTPTKCQHVVWSSKFIGWSSCCEEEGSKEGHVQYL